MGPKMLEIHVFDYRRSDLPNFPKRRRPQKWSILIKINNETDTVWLGVGGGIGWDPKCEKYTFSIPASLK